MEFFSETSLAETNRHICAETFTVKLFPSYTPTIWINLGSAYLLKNGRETYSVDQHTDVLVLRNEIIERRNLPTDNIFTVKFNPGGLEAVMGINQTKIGSAVIPVTEIIPASIIRKLKELSDFKDRSRFLEEFFLEKLRKQSQDDYYLKCLNDTIQVFSASGMKSRNTSLADQLYITEKSLYRYFTKVIGTNPKHYFSILRARTALTAYTNAPALFSPYHYGYYDRSHFYKDVLKFTGQKFALAVK